MYPSFFACLCLSLVYTIVIFRTVKTVRVFTFYHIVTKIKHREINTSRVDFVGSLVLDLTGVCK